MNILHLVKDEKFIDFFARAIDVDKGISHRYIVHTPNLNQPLSHICQVTPFRRVDNSYFSSKFMQDDLASCDVLVVHFLTHQGAKMINAAPANVKVVWSGWGADYYYLLPGGQDELLDPETLEIARIINLQRADKNPLLHARLLLRPVRRFCVHHLHLMPAIRRVNFFSSPIPEDYFLLKNYLNNSFSAAYAQLNYGSVEETFALGSGSNEKRNILVGNSASLTNNHIEIFRLLANHNLTNRKVIVPLSYGDSDYRQIVLEYGRKILGSYFQPVNNFLPLFDYNKLISTCSCAIMNNYRQQALGNIGFILYSGAKLFLNSKNVTSLFFRSRGAHISDINELLLVDDNIFAPLTAQKKLENIRVLEGFWGRKEVIKNSVDFIKKIRN